MSNYTKTTNFTAKDTALVTDPQKVLRGAEFDTEFNNIETAINSKYDTDSIINLNGGTLTDTVLEGAVLNGSVSGSAVLDDDTFGTASSTTLATSESIKALVDSVGVAGITSTATAEQVVLTDNYLTSKNNVWAPKIHFAPDPSQASEDGDQPDGEIGLDAGNIMFLRAGFANAAQIILDPAYPGSTKFQSDVLVEGDLEVNGNVTSGGVPIGNGGTPLPESTVDGATLRWNNTDSKWEASSWLKIPFGSDQGKIEVTLTTITHGGAIYNSRGDGTGLSFGVNRISPMKNAVTGDNETDLGGDTRRFKDGYFAGSVYSNGSPLTRTQDLIEALSTLRAATLDESVDVRQALASACDKLIEKFEAMQQVSTQEISDE